jgi:hypothetical protein
VIKQGEEMYHTEESKQEKLARLQQELECLKNSWPEHCTDTGGYVNVHRVKPEQMQKIEDLEDEIEQLKSELSG